MNRERGLYIILFSSIILFVFSYIVDLLEGKRQKFNIDRESYESILHEKEAELEKTIKNVNDILKKSGEDKTLTVKSFFDKIDAPENIIN